MKLCGLTGGVGMGKSTAAGFFLARSARVIDTDDLARQLVQPGQPALAEIQAAFGSQMLTPAGELRRDELARLVFADTAARQQLEAILHPRIRASWLAQAEQWNQASSSPSLVVLIVIPLLFETHAESCFQKIICVACSPATQRERLATRGWSPAQILQRCAAQWPVAEKMARSHYVLWTEGSPASSAQQVRRIWDCLKNHERSENER